MATCSKYLLRPPRTLRQACRDTSGSQSELAVKDCGRCANRELCEIDEDCVRAALKHRGPVLKDPRAAPGSLHRKTRTH